MATKDKKQYLDLLQVLKKIKAEDRAKIPFYLNSTCTVGAQLELIMRGELLTGSFGLTLFRFLFPDYCLVYVVGISALHSIHPGAGVELADPGPPELEGRRGRTPYRQDPLEGVDIFQTCLFSAKN